MREAMQLESVSERVRRERGERGYERRPRCDVLRKERKERK